MLAITIEEIKNKAVPVLRNHDVEFAAVFGSIARGEAQAAGDVDLLVRFRTTPGLISYIGLENELADVLGRKVDLATEASLHRLMKSNILRDLKTIYEQR